MDVGKPRYCIQSFVFITKRILLFSLILVIFLKCSPNEFDDTEIKAEVSYRIGIDIHDTNVIYKKSAGSDRWTPKTSRRPERKVYFFGISSSVPSIENEKGNYCKLYF